MVSAAAAVSKTVKDCVEVMVISTTAPPTGAFPAVDNVAELTGALSGAVVGDEMQNHPLEQ